MATASNTRTYLAGGFFLAVAAQTTICAQVARAEPSPPVEETATGDPGEIIVTAQRRAERLEDVPVSIVSIDAKTVERSGVTNIDQLGAIAPGVQVNHAGGAVQPSIRGVTSLTNANGFENNIAIYVDGFYVPDMISANSDFGGIENIEVLKGPQGALYGRNATGGAILITTKKPSAVLTGDLQASYATFDDITLSGYMSGPLSQAVRFSLNGYDRRSDGYIRLSDPSVIGGRLGNAAKMKQQSFRGKIEADVTDRLAATLALSYSLQDDPRGNLFTPIAHIPATVARPPLRAAGGRTVSFNYDTVNRSSVRDVTFTLKYNTEIGTISSYTGYARRYQDAFFDFDGTYADTGYSQQRYKDDTFQQTTDFSITAVDRLNLIFGTNIYFDNIRTHEPTARTAYGPGLTVLNVNRQGTKSEAMAVYVDATYQLTDALSVSAGGRYSDEKKTISIEQAGTGAFPLLVRSASFRKLTPRASLRYEFAPRTNVYASYSTGFRSGNFPTSGSPATIVAIKPEVVRAYEIGFKTARSNFRLDLAAFYNADRDLHVSSLVPVCVGTACVIQNRIANAPKARSYGGEALLTIFPVEDLNVRIGAAYLNAKYTDFPNASGVGLNAATDTNVTAQQQNWNGQQMARSPKFTGSIGADYTIAIAGGGLRLAGNVAYTDSYVLQNPSLFGPLAGSLANIQRYRQKAYTLVNASAVWTDRAGRYSLGVFGNNLTDASYLLTYNGSVNGDYATLATPRQIGVRGGVKF